MNGFRKLVLSLAFLAALTVAGIVLIARWTAPTNVTTMERFEQLTAGMTEAEVVAVLGSDGVVGSKLLCQGLASLLDDTVLYKEWRGPNKEYFVVGFDEAGRLIATASARLNIEDDWRSRLRRWFGLDL